MIKQLNVLTSDTSNMYDAIKEAFAFMLVNNMDKAALKIKDNSTYLLELNFSQTKNTITGKFTENHSNNNE